MSIESILRQKGTDVATIGREANIKSAADWLRVKNIGALVVTSGEVVHRPPDPGGLLNIADRFGALRASTENSGRAQHGLKCPTGGPR
jgi:hypothetical protein